MGVNEYIIQGAVWTVGIVTALAINRWASKKWRQEDEVQKDILKGIEHLSKCVGDLKLKLEQISGKLATTEVDLRAKIISVDEKADRALNDSKENRDNILKYVSEKAIKQ